jgi:hypothetical protein
MASPQILTGYEPSGGSSAFNHGWGFLTDKVYNRSTTLPPQGRFSTWAGNGLSIAGFDLFATVNIDSVYNALKLKVSTAYYISLWRNPPSIFGTGFDYYFAVAICTTT